MLNCVSRDEMKKYVRDPSIRIVCETKCKYFKARKMGLSYGDKELCVGYCDLYHKDLYDLFSAVLSNKPEDQPEVWELFD